jgi:hypothetical protein
VPPKRRLTHRATRRDTSLLFLGYLTKFYQLKLLFNILLDTAMYV